MAFQQQQQGQIPQALQYLTNYLDQSTKEQLVQNKEDSINQTVADVSKQFSALGPNATEQDARTVFYDALGKAAQNGVAQETTPLLQNLYNQSTQYIALQRAQNQDANYADALKTMFPGMAAPTGSVSGAQLGNLVNLGERATVERPTQNAAGQSGIQAFKFNGAGYAPAGEMQVLNPTTTAEKTAQDLSVYKAKKQLDFQYSQRLINSQTPTFQTGGGYMGQVSDGKGGTVQVPLQTMKGKPGYFYFAGGQLNQYDPLANGSPTKYVDPLLSAEREQKLSGTTPTQLRIQHNATGGALINLLHGENLLSNSSAYVNINSGALTAGAPQQLSTDIQSGGVRLNINKIKDPTKRTQALALYGQFIQQEDPKTYEGGYNRVKAAFDTQNSEMWAIQQMLATAKGYTNKDPNLIKDTKALSFQDFADLNEGLKADIIKVLNKKK